MKIPAWRHRETVYILWYYSFIELSILITLMRKLTPSEWVSYVPFFLVFHNKGFSVPPCPSLSGMPNSNFSSTLGLQPSVCLAASFSIRLPGSQWHFVLHTIPACAPSASPPSFIHDSHVEARSYGTKLHMSGSLFG